MVWLPINPITLGEYVESYDDFLNDRRNINPVLAIQINTAHRGLKELASELDRHSLRLSHGNCSPTMLVSHFTPNVTNKIAGVKANCRTAIETSNHWGRTGKEATAALKECYEMLSAKARAYEVELTDAVSRKPNHRFGYTAVASFLPKRVDRVSAAAGENTAGRSR